MSKNNMDFTLTSELIRKDKNNREFIYGYIKFNDVDARCRIYNYNDVILEAGSLIKTLDSGYWDDPDFEQMIDGGAEYRRAYNKRIKEFGHNKALITDKEVHFKSFTSLVIFCINYKNSAWSDVKNEYGQPMNIYRLSYEYLKRKYSKGVNPIYSKITDIIHARFKDEHFTIDTCSGKVSVQTVYCRQEYDSYIEYILYKLGISKDSNRIPFDINNKIKKCISETVYSEYGQEFNINRIY